MPIVLNLFRALAISIFVPTPSVLATMCTFFKFEGILVTDPKLPILLSFFIFVLF